MGMVDVEVMYVVNIYLLSMIDLLSTEFCNYTIDIKKVDKLLHICMYVKCM